MNVANRAQMSLGGLVLPTSGHQVHRKLTPSELIKLGATEEQPVPRQNQFANTSGSQQVMKAIRRVNKNRASASLDTSARASAHYSGDEISEISAYSQQNSSMQIPSTQLQNQQIQIQDRPQSLDAPQKKINVFMERKNRVLIESLQKNILTDGVRSYKDQYIRGQNAKDERSIATTVVRNEQSPRSTHSGGSQLKGRSLHLSEKDDGDYRTISSTASDMNEKEVNALNRSYNNDSGVFSLIEVNSSERNNAPQVQRTRLDFLTSGNIKLEKENYQDGCQPLPKLANFKQNEIDYINTIKYSRRQGGGAAGTLECCDDSNQSQEPFMQRAAKVQQVGNNNAENPLVQNVLKERKILKQGSNLKHLLQQTDNMQGQQKKQTQQNQQLNVVICDSLASKSVFKRSNNHQQDQNVKKNRGVVCNKSAFPTDEQRYQQVMRARYESIQTDKLPSYLAQKQIVLSNALNKTIHYGNLRVNSPLFNSMSNPLRKIKKTKIRKSIKNPNEQPENQRFNDPQSGDVQYNYFENQEGEIKEQIEEKITDQNQIILLKIQQLFQKFKTNHENIIKGTNSNVQQVQAIPKNRNNNNNQVKVNQSQKIGINMLFRLISRKFNTQFFFALMRTLNADS